MSQFITQIGLEYVLEKYIKDRTFKQIYFVKKRKKSMYQGWGAGVGAGCFWLLVAGAAWKKSQEPEPEPLKN